MSLRLEKQPRCVWQNDKAPSLMTHFRRTALVSNNFALCCDFRGCELKKKIKKKNQKNQLSSTENGGHVVYAASQERGMLPQGRPTHAEMEVPAAKARLAP